MNLTLFDQFDLLLKVVVILGLTIAAFINDLKSYRISNRLILLGLFVAIIFLFLTFISGGSYISLIKGGAFSFTIFYLCFLVRAIGAGDAKLLTVIGLIGGIEVMFRLMIVIAFLSIVACAIVLLRAQNHDSRQLGIIRKGMQLHVFHFSYVVLASELICFGQVLLQMRN